MLAFLSCGIAPNASAVVPPPDGGYPNNNTAEGDSALFNLTNGFDNTAIGFQALFLNTEGDFNTASGADALAGNHGSFNTANGYQALLFNTGGGYNTATGTAALRSNISGFQNLANGVNALYSNATGYRNTANGYQALYFNTTGNRNTAEGFQALFHNIGSDNVGLGFNAGSNLTTGSGNVCIGNGVLGVAGESNTTRIKNVYSSVASGRAVYVSSDNKMGTLVSSRRFKDQIQPMDKASESILALKPVTFHYKKEIEPNGSVMFGLIAEEVEQVDRDLVTLNDKGEVEAVRYEAVNAMLLNEFLKEHRTVQDLKSTVAKQEATIAQQQTSFQSKLAEQEGKLQRLVWGYRK
jgi:Chaperone of endosialidase